ncbi:uncharacterized protein LOC118802387, partial [Colossoma macropomum]|uniref:uncharacterized protein LOC118802387 n=1 Tax=Colossoma macropomum TaxID=42526 RepID=UPI00186483CC
MSPFEGDGEMTESMTDGEQRANKDEDKAGNTGIYTYFSRNVYITAYTGDSAFLPCSSYEHSEEPQQFYWSKRDKSGGRDVDYEYRGRRQIQLFDDVSTGNFSLLIPHLTEEDEGEYECFHTVTDMVMCISTVKVTVRPIIPCINIPMTSTRGPGTSTPISAAVPASDIRQASADPHSSQSVTYLPIAVVATIIFHIVFALMFHFKKTKVPVPANVHCSTADPEEAVMKLQLDAPITPQLQRINQAEEIQREQPGKTQPFFRTHWKTDLLNTIRDHTVTPAAQ